MKREAVVALGSARPVNVSLYGVLVSTSAFAEALDLDGISGGTDYRRAQSAV